MFLLISVLYKVESMKEFLLLIDLLPPSAEVVFRIINTLKLFYVNVFK